MGHLRATRLARRFGFKLPLKVSAQSFTSASLLGQSGFRRAQLLLQLPKLMLQLADLRPMRV
ncbi:MAG: hypothetical protein JF606_19040 [Burkholderiales bacterium]|jgi:hypothetical protein|nr:hypothetical protein [Burkholderiales bacterium]